MNDVFVVSASRTAIGAFGGALRRTPPAELGVIVVRDALTKSGLSADLVEHVIFGQVIQSGSRDLYLARVIGVNSAIPKQVPAVTVNRLCGSGMQAIIQAAQLVRLGEVDIAVAGGAENMSMAPYQTSAVRWGSKMGDITLNDALDGALRDPFDRIHMGITAENVARKYGISREAQDALAEESHRRAARAIAEGRFSEQIVPVEVKSRKGTEAFATDEHVRKNTSIENLSTLRPVFQKDGTVTAGNSSGINDGAAAVVIASQEAVKRHNLTPLARLVSYGFAGVEPSLMGIGPIPATRRALVQAGMEVADLGVIESNEAFAAQACAVSRELGFDPARVNPNGSGISLGHPVGATGAIITVKLVHELKRTGAKTGLATMCIGGGQGIATVYEKC